MPGRLVSLAALLLVATSIAGVVSAAAMPIGVVHELSQRSRSLLQAECPPLKVDSKTYTFNACEDLSPRVGQPFTLFYTLEPSPSGGTLFKGGIKAQSTTGFSAIGFGARMLRTNSVIVYPDSASPSGASVDGYLLSSYSAAQINAAKGSYPLQDTAAEKTADGFLVAVFTAPLDGAPETWAGQMTSMVYVTDGVMSGNQLRGHSNANCGTVRVAVPVTAVATKAAATTTTPATPATPTPTPIADASQGAAQVTAPTVPEPTVPAQETVPVDDGDGDKEGASEGGPYPMDGLDYGKVDINGGQRGPAGMPPSSTPTNASACSTTINGQAKSYNSCYSVNKLTPDFKVYYSYAADPADATSSILSMAFSGTTNNGYLSVGFPSKPADMTDASAMILTACASCPSGAEIQQYYMSGTRVQDVQVANNMEVSDMQASAVGSMIYGSFIVKLPGVAAPSAASSVVGGARRRRRSLQAFEASSYPLIYAAGDLTSTGGLQQHFVEGDGNIDLSLGLASANSGDISDSVQVTDSSEENAKLAHMWMMAIGWGLIIPVGIVTARYFKAKGCWWFKAHAIMQSLGFLIVLVGLALGFVANGGWETDDNVHRDLGMTATALGLVQVLALVARPSPKHRYRSYWYYMHAWIGRSAAIIAIANIYYGILKIEELGTWAWATYTAVLGVIVLVALFLEAQGWAAAGGNDDPSTANTSDVASGQNGDKEFITSSAASSSAKLNGNAVP